MHEVDRTRRVSELVKREVASLIAHDLNDDRINRVTVTAVTVSRDLKRSTVYVSAIDNQLGTSKIESLLNKSAGYLRRLLSKRLEMRTTPALVFKYDNSIEKGVRMSNLIDKLNRKHGQ
jgi:ribosome-binding factor A